MATNHLNLINFETPSNNNENHTKHCSSTLQTPFSFLFSPVNLNKLSVELAVTLMILISIRIAYYLDPQSLPHVNLSMLILTGSDEGQF